MGVKIISANTCDHGVLKSNNSNIVCSLSVESGVRETKEWEMGKAI